VEKVTANWIQGIASSKEQGEEGSKQKAGSTKQQADQERRTRKNVHFFRRWINSCEYGTEPFSKRRLDQ